MSLSMFNVDVIDAVVDSVLVIDAAIGDLVDAVPVAVNDVDAIVDSSKMSLLTPSS